MIGADHYVTSPPSETPRDLADFQSRLGEAPRFRGKRTRKLHLVDAGWGDAKAVQPEAAGKLAGGKGGSYPLAGGSDDPSQFIRIDRAFCVELPSVATDELAGGRQ